MPFGDVTLKAMKPVALPYPDYLETIGDHIKTRRFDLGLFQKDIAAQLGVNVNTVNNWEKNHSSPQLYLLPRIIEFKGYDPLDDDSESLSLGEQVVRARRRLGITRKDLARRLRVDPSTLAHWENGRRLPMPENRAKLEKLITTV